MRLMNRKNIWIVGFVVAILLVGGIWWAVSKGPSDDAALDQVRQSKVTTVEATKFRAEYPGMAEDNRFVYADVDDVLEVLESGSGLVFLGFKECPWCQQLAPIVDEAAKAEGLGKVYYLDIRSARETNDETYQKLIAKLSNFLEKDEDGQPRIYVPDVTAVSRGEVVGRFEQDPSGEGENVTPATYWTEERRGRGVDQLRGIILKIKMDFTTVERDVSYGARLLDVRTAREFNDGHFANATNLDVVDIERGKLPDVSRSEAIYLYCRSGNRSAAAKDLLEKAGFINVIDLGGLGEVEAMGGKLAVE